LRTAGRSGPLSKSIRVTSNDPKTPQFTLTLKGEVLVDVSVSPRHINFGQLGKKETSVKPFAIKVSNPDKIKVTDVEVDDSRFEVVFKKGDRSGDATYDLKFKGSNAIERISTNLAVEFEGSDAPPARVRVRASITGDLNYTRNLYFVKKDGSFPSRDVKISSRSGRQVKILRVETSSAEVDAEIIARKGAEAKVKITVRDPSRSFKKPARGSFEIITTDKEQKKLVVRYMITERRAPRTKPVIAPVKKIDAARKLKLKKAPGAPPPPKPAKK
jgi:hypothetical protein